MLSTDYCTQTLRAGLTSGRNRVKLLRSERPHLAARKPEWNRQGRQDTKGKVEIAECEQGRQPALATRLCFGDLMENSYLGSRVVRADRRLECE